MGMSKVQKAIAAVVGVGSLLAVLLLFVGLCSMLARWMLGIWGLL